VNWAARHTGCLRCYTLVDAQDLARFGSEFHWPLLAGVGRTKDQPVAIERVDSQKRLPRVGAKRVREVDGFGLPGRVEFEDSLDGNATVGERDNERVAGEGCPRLRTLFIERLFDAVSLVSNLLPVAVEFLQVFRDGLRHFQVTLSSAFE